MQARFEYTPLTFKRPAGTSRGELTIKHSWLVYVQENGITGVGECSVIPGLSPDFQSLVAYENQLTHVVECISSGQLTVNNLQEHLGKQPSILFGVECAFLDFYNGGTKIYFNNAFSQKKLSIPINGLVWMGSEAYMYQQIEQKIMDGFTTIKMKIGAIDFATEINLLRSIRERYNKEQITLRVDANGAFTPKTIVPVLEQLAALDVHSIEQPIKAGQWLEMQQLCATTPLPIALDEELIGIHALDEKEALLEMIAPQFIILKPSLHGGIAGSKEWIRLATDRYIDWWMTSALESNIGLKAICEFTAEFSNPLPQGLGTGSLYVSNFETELTVENGTIFLR